MELSSRQPIFVGFKMDGTLKRHLQALEGPDKRYVSAEDSTFLRICTLNGDEYVGKVIEDGLSTDRVDDVRRNVLSILQRLAPDFRLPSHLEILACPAEDSGAAAASGEPSAETGSPHPGDAMPEIR